MNNKKPLVSIACITFNQELYIRECIESFLMQKTSFPIEIIIHDDASTDNTAIILKEYTDKYPELIVPIFQTVNQYSKGINPGFEFVFPKCSGKYIAVCEGDDCWTDPLKLQKQVDFLEENDGYGLVITDADFYFQETGIIQPAIFQNGLSFIDTAYPIKSSGYMANMTWLFRKELLQYVDFYTGCTDGALLLYFELAQHSKVHFLPIVTGRYRISEGTASRPIGKIKQYQYHKDLFDLQKYFIERYKINKEIADPVLLNTALTLLPKALAFKDDAFIEEAKSLFERNQLNTKLLIDLFNDYIQFEKELIGIKASKAYRLGKFILKPFSFFKNKFK